MYLTLAAAFVAALLLLSPTSAFAYLDPGTGSYVIQMIIAGLLGAAFAIKMYWMRIKRFLVGIFSKNERGN
jgi:hypothetical protein